MKIITISGASGSGKSTLSNYIKKIIPECLLLSIDRYYLSKDEQIEKNGFYNFDDPKSIDVDLLKKNLSELKKEGNAKVPKYDFTVSKRSGYEKVTAEKIVIVDGIFSGLLLEDQCDLKIFVDVDLDLALIRRIERDTVERGRTVESVLNQYRQFVRPSYFQFVDQIKSVSDIVFKNNGAEEEFLSEIEEKLEHIIL